MTLADALRKLRCLEWTEERRPDHPWCGQLMVNRKDVEQLLKEVTP